MNHFRDFLKSQSGVAMLEFSISLPFLILLLFGSVEATRYLIITQKVDRVANTLSDVITQSEKITSTDIDQIITATGQVMQPYDFSADGYVVISSVSKNGSNEPVVNWQYTSTGTIHSSQIGTSGSTATMPSNFTMVDKDTVIVTEVFYNYTPILSNLIYSSSSLYRISIYKPRLGNLTTLG